MRRITKRSVKITVISLGGVFGLEGISLLFSSSCNSQHDIIQCGELLTCMIHCAKKRPESTRERITLFSLDQVDTFIYINDIANYTSRQITHQKGTSPTDFSDRHGLLIDRPLLGDL